MHSSTQSGQSVLVCVDSYRSGIPEGRILHPDHGAEYFESLSQFLVKMENLLEIRPKPQAFNAIRCFGNPADPLSRPAYPSCRTGGLRATFQVQILFRQHSSWQGILTWREGNQRQPFRSVLELVMMMDGALRTPKEAI